MAEDGEWPCTEAGRGAQLSAIDLKHDAVERQYEKRQENVDHGYVNAGTIVNEGQRLAYEPVINQKAIDYAILLQEQDPRHGANQHRGPERQEYRDKEQSAEPTLRSREDMCHRETDNQA